MINPLKIYLYYDLARKFAQRHAADEAIILNPDHTISKTNTASIFAIKDKVVIVNSPRIRTCTCRCDLKICAGYLN